MDETKAVIKGDFIALNAQIRKTGHLWRKSHSYTKGGESGWYQTAHSNTHSVRK